MAQDITVTLTANTKQFDRSIKQSKGEVQSFEKGGVAAFGKVAAAVGGLIAAAKGLQGIVTTGAKFQDLQDSLNAVFGSAKKGEAAFKRIKDFSLRTQFGVDTLTNAFIQLKGAGVEPTEELLMVFADTASVTTDQMGTFQAALDLVSRSTAGGLGLEDLNRLADRGIPVFQILQEKLGLARLEVSEFGKTTEGANQIIAALTDGLQERFGGVLQTKLDNVSVKFSNLKIAVQNLAAEIFVRLEPALDAILTSLTDATTEATEFVGTFRDLGQVFEDLAAKVGPVLDKLDQFSAIIAALLAPAVVSGVTLITRRIVGVTKAILSIIPAIGGVLAAFVTIRGVLLVGFGLIVVKVAELVSNLATVDDTFRNKLVVGIKIFANTVLGVLRGLGEAFLQLLIGPAKEIGKFFSDPLNYELPAVGDMGSKLAEKFNEGFKKGASLFEIPEEYKEIQDNFQDLSLDFGEIETPEIPGITDLGFIMEDQAAKVFVATERIKQNTKDLATTLGDIGKQIKVGFLDTLGNAQKALSEDLATALVEGQSTLDSFKNFFKKIVKDMIAQALRLMIIQPILSSIFGAFNMPIKFSAGGQASFVPKARGGPVSAGGTYLVGEEGPEILQMGSMGGNIVPNGQIGGGTSVTYNINAVDSQSFQMALAKDPSFVFAVTEAGRRKQPGRI